MALPIIVPLLINGSAILTGGAYVYNKQLKIGKTEEQINTAEKKYKQAMKDNGLESLDEAEVARELYHQGKFTEEEYKQISKALNKYEKNDKNLEKFFNGLSESERDAIMRYYNVMSTEAPQLKDTVYRSFENLSTEDRRALFGVPTLETLSGPNYLDTDFEGYQREVEPVKLWTGQELADLHNLDFNPDNYYNLVKAGTSAAVDAARYTSEQMNNASMIDDTENVASYLDSIRNTKAEALSTGATLGQRAANELLANQESLNNYSTNQAAVADARFQAVDDALLADAQARLTAHDYFTQLAKSLAADSMTLYDNDSTRYAQDMLSNAELYRADQELRGERLLANSKMYADWLQGNAQIAAYQSQADARMNEYFWLYNNALRANNNDHVRAKADVDNLIYHQYTGYRTPYDMYIDK